MRYAQAFSGQPSAPERPEIVAASKEYGGIVIPCAARKPSAVSPQRSEWPEIVAACKEYGGIVAQLPGLS